MDINHKGQWGYHPLVLSLSNTGEPLYVVNRSGNRPHHEQAAFYFDRAIALCRKAGFRKIRLRMESVAACFLPTFGSACPAVALLKASR